MSNATDLYRLQEIDSDIAAKELALSEIDARLADTEELERTRETLEERREIRKELDKKQREVEWEVDELDSKIEPLDKKLYGGTIGNPKELAALQEDVDSLKARKRQVEDELLEVMSAAEDAQQAQAEAARALAELEERWEADRARLLSEQQDIRAGLATLEEKRHQHSGQVDAESLRLYETLRASRQGKAVAKVERGTCQGCRITLPMTLLQKARSGAVIVQCSSCERILYVS
jgi:predicted  nucleic acid-binding Zn-ribbon protein